MAGSSLGSTTPGRPKGPGAPVRGRLGPVARTARFLGSCCFGLSPLLGLLAVYELVVAAGSSSGEVAGEAVMVAVLLGGLTLLLATVGATAKLLGETVEARATADRDQSLDLIPGYDNRQS